MTNSLVLRGLPRAAACFVVFAAALAAQPAISLLNPAAATAGGPAFSLVITGTGFNATSVVRWNGSNLSTTPFSATLLTAVVEAARIATPTTATITVFGPNGTSAGSPFPVVATGATALTTLSPASATAGMPGFTLTVLGTGLSPAHVVRWTNGASTNLTTFYGSPTSLSAFVPTALLASVGTASVTAVHTQSLAVSNGINLPINAEPVPVLAAITPSSVVHGSGGFTLIATGTGFTPLSEVRWNGAAQPTTWVSAGEIRAAIAPALVATPGFVSITVFNPAPGGGTSGGQSFAVNAAVPTAQSVSPTSFTAGAAATTVTVTGSGYHAQSQVRWNGAALPTTLLAVTTLRATVAAPLLAAGGTAAVTVFNPPPGGGSSGFQTITINNPVPALTNLSPASVAAGSAAFVLTASGSGLNVQTQVRWNGAPLAIAAASPTAVQAQVPASLLAAAGTATVQLVNPAPGGGASVALTFGICSTGVVFASGFEPQAPGAVMTATPDAEGWVRINGVQKILPDNVSVSAPCLFPTQGNHWCEVSNHQTGPASPPVPPSTPQTFPFAAGTVSEMRVQVQASCPPAGPPWLNVDWRFVTREGPQGSGAGFNDFAQILVLDPQTLMPVATLLYVDTYPPWTLAGGNACSSAITGVLPPLSTGGVGTSSVQLSPVLAGRPILLSVVVANQGDASAPSSLFLDNLRFTSAPQGIVAGTAFDLRAETTTGTGNVIFGVSQVPASATEVLILVSTTPAPGGLGTGPLLGLVPDAFLLMILVSPSTPFAAFHFPASASPYAAGPISLPPGSFPLFSGQIWECKAVTYNLQGLFGQSPLRQLVW